MKENTKQMICTLIKKVEVYDKREIQILEKMDRLEKELEILSKRKKELIENICSFGYKSLDRNNKDTEKTIADKNKYNQEVLKFKIEELETLQLIPASEEVKKSFKVLTLEDQRNNP